MFLNAFRRLFINSQNRKARRTSGSPRLELLSLENRITPTTFTVNTTSDTVDSDPNVTSLREAITLANTTPGNDQISFNLTGSSPYTITLAGALPTILDATATASGTGGTGTTVGTLTITGLGSSSLIISGDNGVSGRDFRIFSIASGGNLSISGVTVSGAQTSGDGGAFANFGTLAVSDSAFSGNTANFGGGIFNNGGNITISNSTFSGNIAGPGGAIFNGGFGSLTLLNSTLFSNTAGANGGAVWNDSNLNISNSTISGNNAANGGGIWSSGTLNIANTIIANSTSGGDYAGNGNVNLISSGNGSDPTVPANNIVTQATSSATSAWAQSVTSAQLNLGPLQNNGGPTQTLALLNGSAAIGAGNVSISNNPIYANGKDQRGINRTTSDIGAYSFGIQVTTTAPSGTGSLDAAITLANNTPGNDQISFNLTGASSYTITLASALPTIVDASTSVSGGTAGTVTINGLGATVLTISGSDPTNPNNSTRNFRIFNIASGGNLSISGVTVSGAKISSDGGAFRNQGILSVNNSTISGNDSGAFGGGIFNQSGTVTVSNSIFSGNTALQGGGGICNTGSTGSEGAVTISNSTFSGNTATSGSGGGILNKSSSILNINNSTLSGNTANSSGGGAIRNESSSSTLNINNSTISGNSAGEGGGIRNGGTLNISNSTLSGNNGGGGGGGGISNDGTLNISNSTFSGNTANSSGGGAIQINSGTVTISNSTISGNSATNGGGLRNRYGTLNIANTIIANSTSGGDYVGGNNATIGTNTNNLVEDGSISGAIAADPLLGPLANNGGPTFTMALLAGSPAIAAGNATVSNASPVSGVDQRGINRTTSDIGAYSFGIQVNTTADTIDSDPNVTSLREAITLANTTAGDDQISFKLTGSSSYIITLASALPPIVSASTSVSGGTAGNITITGLGASSLTIDASGGNFSIFSIDTGGNLSISGVTVSGANLNGNGGAFNNAGTLSIANSTISGNTANNGGGITNSGTLTVNNSTISDNSATSGSGGGITNSGTLTVNNSTLSGNSATAVGGGIFNGNSLTITNSTLSGNTATGNGGGVYNNGTVNIANTIIANSTSNSTSGGDFVGGQPVFSTNNIVEDGSITSGALAVDPFLGLLQNNGGPTFTMALTSLSPISVTAGGNATISNAAPISGKDQRGYARSTTAPSIGAFEYNGIAPAPTVNNISPVTGSTVGGTNITITGTYFTGATAVTIGGTAATNFTVVNDSTITVTTPAHAVGTASVVVTTPGGTNAANTLFTYAAAPTVTSISPTSGPIAGGTNLIITGTNFTGATGVTIGGTAATNLVVNSPTSITVTAPAHAAGTASVLVTTPGGTNATNTLFTYFGAATQANITTLPAGIASGSPFTTQPVITIMDALGNTVTNSTASVTMTVSGNGTTLGTTTVNAVAGVATFTNVGISGTAGAAYTLTFTSGSLTTATQSITPTFGTATQATLSTSAAGSASGSAFTTQPVITIQDAFGNIITNSTASVTMTVSGNGTTLGTTTVNAVAGVATFTNVGISGTAGTAYTLTFTSGSLTTATQSITPTFGTATQATLSTSAAGSVSGSAFTTQPIITIQDAFGNTVTNSTASVTMTVSGNGITVGTTTVNAVAGVATFTNVGISGTAGTAYTLTFTSGSLTTATQSITPTFGLATQATLSTQAAGSASGSAFTTQPVITIKDAFGNTVTNSTASVTMTVSGNGTTVGTTTVNAVAGVATFTDVGISGTAGTAYTLTFTSGSLTTATQSITPTFGIATRATLSTSAAGSVSGSAFTTQPVITIQDAFGNTVTNSTASVTMTVSGNGTTVGTTTVNSVNGVATFTNVGISGTAGTDYILTFASNGLTSAAQIIRPTFGTATQATLSTNPAGAVSGSAFTTQPVVTIQDAFGNTVTNSTASVTMTVSGNGTTVGTTPVNAVAGVATFTNVGISGTAGTPYTLTFASNGLTSSTQSITPLGAANTPTFGAPTSTANGFTVLITNYDPNFTYGGTAAPNGTVAISSNGLVTVSGVAAGTSSTATITTTRTNYVSGSAQVTATSLNAANTPSFGAPTATTDGFTVLITNYDPNFTYGGTATANGTVAISSTGLVTVSGVAANTSSTATITTTRNNHLTGSGQVTATSLAPTAPLVTGTPPPTSSGGSSTVTLYDPVTGAEAGTAVPFPGFSGPVKVVSGDFNSDGVADIIAGAGVGGGPAIAILDSQTGQVIGAFFAFDQAFTGGVFIAVQDTNGDGILDIIASAGPGGGPEVRIFNGANLNILRSFYAYAEDFSGGVSVASIDFNNDGILDIVTGAGPGGAPHVKVFDGATNAIISQWYAYPVTFTGGVFVAVGDIGNDNTFEVVTGAGQGGTPVVAVWDPFTGALLAQFMAYAEDFTGGVRVGINDGNSDGIADILTGAGPGGGPQVNVFNFPALDLLFSFYSGDPASTGGVFVG